MSSVLMLRRSQIVRLVSQRGVLELLKAGFIANAASDDDARAARYPVKLPAPAPAGASGMVLAPGMLPDIPVYTVKVHAKFPDADPAIQGVILLHSIQDGGLLAILESTYITALRTGYVGALGAETLARKDAASMAIIGAGVQGAIQLECVQAVRGITNVRVFDIVPERAVQFAEREGANRQLAIEPVKTVSEAVENADIVVTATWAVEPFLDVGMLRPGTHVTTLGPDQPGKAEVSAGLIRESAFVADDADLSVSMGAIGGVGLGAEAIHAELGEILTGEKAGRTKPEQITIFGAVGLPFQDLAVAWLAYSQAVHLGIGERITLRD